MIAFRNAFEVYGLFASIAYPAEARDNHARLLLVTLLVVSDSAH